MSGVYRPTEGTVNLDDDRPVTEMRSVLGVVPESTGLYPNSLHGKTFDTTADFMGSMTNWLGIAPIGLLNCSTLMHPYIAILKDSPVE